MRKNYSKILAEIYSLLIKLNARIGHHYWTRLYTKEFKKIGPSFSIKQPSRIINPKYISIGNHFFSLANLRIEAIDDYAKSKYTPEIVIGNNVDINTDCHIACINKVYIGNNVLIASKVFISDHSHGEINIETMSVPPSKRQLFSKGPVIIKDNVWIGEGACILPGVVIGENAIIGANAVVTKNIPPNAIVAGIPARVLRIIF